MRKLDMEIVRNYEKMMADIRSTMLAVLLFLVTEAEVMEVIAQAASELAKGGENWKAIWAEQTVGKISSDVRSLRNVEKAAGDIELVAKELIEMEGGGYNDLYQWADALDYTLKHSPEMEQRDRVEGLLAQIDETLDQWREFVGAPTRE